MPIKFLHAADLHLDSPLRGLSAYPDAPAERLRTATRDAFENLVELAIDEAVDFVVIAGDVYDGGWKDFNTGLFFIRQMGRLQRAGIPVHLLHGNHDAASEMTRRLELPDNVHVFDARRAATHRIDALKVALHGRSFKEARTEDNLAASYPAPVSGWLNIGVLHTALEGDAAHARYAPCSEAELLARGYQYWALGHVHAQRVWGEPGCRFAFPGNLQGRHIRETGAKGALLVHAADGEVTAVEPRELDVLRWHALEVDVSHAADMPGALRLVGRQLDTLLADASPHHALAVRVTLVGATAAHAGLRARPAQLRHEVLALAVARDADRLWIEKVQVDTTLPGRSAAASPSANAESAENAEGAESADDIGSLQALRALALEAAADPDFLQALRDELQPMLDKLPHEVLEATDELESLRDSGLANLVRATVPDLIARLGPDAAA